MKKETKSNLYKAIQKHNETQDNEENRVNLEEVLTEIGSVDNDEIEQQAKKIKDDQNNEEQ